jgi:hypothetical protein
MGTGICLWHGQFLSRDRACRALSEMSGCAPSPGALAAAARRTAGLLAPALKAITGYLVSAGVVHFDETGFRAAGRLAWVHSASRGKFVLVTVHAKRGKDGMKAAGILPFFTGIAVHDAWKPYDTFENVAGHALCGAHVLRELVAVTETGTDLDKAWARQAIDALLNLDKAAEAARAEGKDAIDPQVLAEHEDWYRKAAAAGIALNAGRHGKLQEKRHALAKRRKDREDDYLRYARDLRVPFTDNAAEQAIRMSKLRIKISGCMRSMTGAEEFCAIRSYLATAARHGITGLEALTSAFQGRPWIPKPDRPARHQSAGQPEPESRPTYLVTRSLAIALVPYSLAYLSYRGAIVAAHEYGAAVCALIDLDRFAFHDALRVPQPKNAMSERGGLRTLSLERRPAPVPAGTGVRGRSCRGPRVAR